MRGLDCVIFNVSLNTKMLHFSVLYLLTEHINLLHFSGYVFEVLKGASNLSFHGPSGKFLSWLPLLPALSSRAESRLSL